MDDHINFRQGPPLQKFHPLPHPSQTAQSHPSQPRLSYNANLPSSTTNSVSTSTSTKQLNHHHPITTNIHNVNLNSNRTADNGNGNTGHNNGTNHISLHKQQPSKKIPFTPQSYGTRNQLTLSGSINGSKIGIGATGTGGQSVGNSPNTPKHVPSFLQNRNQMKGSLFMGDQGSGKSKNDGAFYNGHYVESNTAKRAPRMSQQPDMKYSAIQLGSQSSSGKIPSFLHEKPQKKQKKIPFQNQLERPQSSKETVMKNIYPIQSLSNSYGNVKRAKAQSEMNSQQLDPASQWVKKSWNKKKQKKLSINDFQQIKDLGSGKYGQVFLAKQKKTNFIFALKIIQKKLLKQQQITQQFIRQLKIQSFLTHPNIIRMYGFFDDLTHIYIILQVGTGGQLFKQLKKHQSMPQPKVATLIRQLCQAINQLHSNHIIHRDIKPENIVLSQGVVKLCDFGWSVYSGQTLRTTFCGTPLYVGPEILKGREYDQKIDIWSLGVMMYEMLVGENPFKITKQEELIKIVKDQIKIPTYVEISEEAKDFLYSCLQKNPEQRLSIRELLNHSFFKKYPEKSDKKMAL